MCICVYIYIYMYIVHYIYIYIYIYVQRDLQIPKRGSAAVAWAERRGAAPSAAAPQADEEADIMCMHVSLSLSL